MSDAGRLPDRRTGSRTSSKHPGLSVFGAWLRGDVFVNVGGYVIRLATKQLRYSTAGQQQQTSTLTTLIKKTFNQHV
jgi:hypothetical protein